MTGSGLASTSPLAPPKRGRTLVVPGFSPGDAATAGRAATAKAVDYG